MKRPLRARDPNGSCAFAVAPYCGGSYLTPAKWQIRDGSCSQKPRTRSRTVGVVSSRRRRDPPHGFSFHKRVARPSLSSAKNSPTARSRLRRSVLAGRKVRARHRHRSGLKIPARPLLAPATPAKAGHAPCFIGPPALQKSAPEYRRLPATRPSDKFTTIYSPGSPISGGHPIHGYAHRVSLVHPCAAFDRPNIIRDEPHAHSSPSATPCASPNTNRCAAFNPSGSRRIRADLAPDGFNTAPSLRA
jgi:hypothetical protein